MGPVSKGAEAAEQWDTLRLQAWRWGVGQIIRKMLELQAEEGWLPLERLEAIASELSIPLHRLESLSTFYAHFLRERPSSTVVNVCRDLSCQLAGGAACGEALHRWAADRQDVEVREISCLGRCDRAPAAAIGDLQVDPTDLDFLGEQLCKDSREPESRDVRAWPEADPYRTDSLEPYCVLRNALEASSEGVIERLEAAGLRGMGGAGFPTARKWALVAAESATPKHVVCNADESEPGTFKDRELLHDLPHLVIEGMLLAAYCTGAERGTIFIRHEYAPERLRLETAITDARAAGALGAGIFGSDFSFDLEVFVSPGGYILGEETALLECIEDRRGEPRNKPPFPGSVGLEGQPTVINNVETLVHSVGIAHWGADWWQGRGREGFSGHKFISTSGDVERPGVEIFGIGTPIAELLEAHGGMKDGAELLAVAPGGASSNFLGPEILDTPLDFDAIAAAGSMLGSGAVVFVAVGRDLLDVGLSITRFFRNESCGKCVPCRVGSEKAVDLIEKSRAVSGGDEALLRSLNETMKETSICGLGQVALGPLLSILDRFPDRIRRESKGHRQ
jgi:NADH:ubiquinone oxidoreductase subunit F (NADH-binding)/NADH:ubiquinone oxidoreductase subunit E